MSGIPLSRSLGFPRSLDEARAGEEYVALYNEMVKLSQDAAGQHGEDDALLATDLTRFKGDRRRSSRNSSPVKTRRARSRALRRQKLNSQSLRSHVEHSRHSSLEQ